MCKIRMSATAIALAAVAACAAAPAARADLKVVESITIDSPQMKKMLADMPPSQRAAMAKGGGAMFDGHPVISTFITSGKKYRTDSGPTIAIIDAGAKKMTLLNPASHTFQSMPFDATSPIAKGITSSIHDTGQTKMILGHKSRHYTMTISMPSMGNTTVKGDIWAAMDLPQPPSLGRAGGPMGMLQDQLKAIKGLPLITTMTVTGSPAGGMTITQVVKSVSTAKLPASLFTIPAGYKAAPAGGMGGMGMGMGR